MKRTFGQFVREEIAKPLEIEFYIGLPSEHLQLVSPLDVRSNGNGTSNESVAYNDFKDNRTYQAEIPTANGITNARSVARFYAYLIDDLEDNKYKRILNEEIFKQATKSNTPANEMDVVLNLTTKFGMGFSLMEEVFPSFGSVVFGHNGNYHYLTLFLIEFLRF
jgi:CubicO group peptidase (beta-lactamase class C family)